MHANWTLSLSSLEVNRIGERDFQKGEVGFFTFSHVFLLTGRDGGDGGD